MSFRNTSIDTVIDGKKVTFKYGMAASEAYTSWMQANPDVLGNMFTQIKGIMFFGLQSGGSKLPKNFNIDKVLDFLDGIEDEKEYQRVKDFAVKCLGFTMTEASDMMAKLGVVVESSVKSEEDLKPS